MPNPPVIINNRWVLSDLTLTVDSYSVGDVRKKSPKTGDLARVARIKFIQTTQMTRPIQIGEIRIAFELLGCVLTHFG